MTVSAADLHMLVGGKLNCKSLARVLAIGEFYDIIYHVVFYVLSLVSYT